MTIPVKSPTVRIESFRDSPENKARVIKIQKDNKASYSDVMREILKLGLDAYEGIE